MKSTIFALMGLLTLGCEAEGMQRGPDSGATPDALQAPDTLGTGGHSSAGGSVGTGGRTSTATGGSLGTGGQLSSGGAMGGSGAGAGGQAGVGGSAPGGSSGTGGSAAVEPGPDSGVPMDTKAQEVSPVYTCDPVAQTGCGVGETCTMAQSDLPGLDYSPTGLLCVNSASGFVAVGGKCGTPGLACITGTDCILGTCSIYCDRRAGAAACKSPMQCLVLSGVGPTPRDPNPALGYCGY